MDGEAGLAGGHVQREKKRSYSHTVTINEDELEEADSDFEECFRKLHKEPEHSLNMKRQHSESLQRHFDAAEPSGFLPAHPVCVPQDKWEIRGGEEASQSSVLEYWVYLKNQHNMSNCPVTRSSPASAVTLSPCPFIAVPSPVAASAVSSELNPMMSDPMTDTCSPISSMCGPTSSAWDTLRSTSRSPGCSEWDPVSAAAHLHLLGESLSLIGLHLQETNKLVSVSSSLSLLLDSLLCALAPLICLTVEIPELGSCTQHTLVSTLENIAYVMPGM